ncbi:MAG TPA: hypothetical protein VFA10_29810 [Ktedonobacteraceae bacterium]|nr:hypothetical protein [Ktedonobacteraceae bacterium]
MRTDNGRPGALRDALGSPEVVEMGVTNHNPVGTINVIRSQAGACSPWNAVDIRIQEEHQRSEREPEGGAAIPVKPCCHYVLPPYNSLVAATKVFFHLSPYLPNHIMHKDFRSAYAQFLHFQPFHAVCHSFLVLEPGTTASAATSALTFLAPAWYAFYRTLFDFKTVECK